MKNLGEVLKKWRVMKELDLRTAAKQMGIISASTLMRIEHGRDPSGKSLAAILNWLLR